jgi:hypothetical protein
LSGHIIILNCIGHDNELTHSEMALLTSQPSLPRSGHSWLFGNDQMSDVLLEFQVDEEVDEGGCVLLSNERFITQYSSVVCLVIEVRGRRRTTRDNGRGGRKVC